MKIEVLGMGCPKCKELERLTIEALKELNINEKVIKVTSIDEIISYGIMGTPALVVNGRVVVSGRLPEKKELLSGIMKAVK